MKVAVIYGPDKVSHDTVNEHVIKEKRDIIPKVSRAAILGSDLHIYQRQAINNGIFQNII